METKAEKYGIFWMFTHLYDHIEDGIYACLHEVGAVGITEEIRDALAEALHEREETLFYELLEKVTKTDGLEGINLATLPRVQERNGDISFTFGWEDVEFDALVEDGHFQIRLCTEEEINDVVRVQEDSTYT